MKTTTSLATKATTTPSPPLPVLFWKKGMRTRSSPVLSTTLPTFATESAVARPSAVRAFAKSTSTKRRKRPGP